MPMLGTICCTNRCTRGSPPTSPTGFMGWSTPSPVRPGVYANEQEEGGPVQSQQPGDLRSEVAALGQAVDDGDLWIAGVLVSEGAHERCARRYETLAEQVEQQIKVLHAAATLPGFGGFESGAALR